jgi:Ser/Thr protein kinase RdoA (MazF antagonist)
MVDSMSDAIMVKGCCTELMTTQAPIVSPAEALELADRVYGLKGTLKLLNGERDANFLIRSSCGALVLKFINPAEDPGVISFQTQALLHIERHGAHLPVPRVLPALSGRLEPKVLVSEQTLTLRTVSYLTVFRRIWASPALR